MKRKVLVGILLVCLMMLGIVAVNSVVAKSYYWEECTLSAKNSKNVAPEEAALIKAKISPSTEEGYDELTIEIHPLEPKGIMITKFWWQIPHQSRDIWKPIECAVGEINIGYEEDVSILTSQSSVLYCYPSEGKQHPVKDTKEEGNIELTRSIVKETIGYLAGIPGAGILIDRIVKWIKGSPIDISNPPHDQYLTDINEYDQYTMIWTAQNSEELEGSGIRYPNYVQISIPLKVEETTDHREIRIYVKLLLEKRGSGVGVPTDIIDKRCLSSIEFPITITKPDLIITSLSWSPEKPEEGDEVTFSYTIENKGTGKAGTSTTALFINKNNVCEDDVSRLDSGSYSEETFEDKWTATAGVVGVHKIRVVADYYEYVEESEEGNNEMIKPLGDISKLIDELVSRWNELIKFLNSLTS